MIPDLDDELPPAVNNDDVVRFFVIGDYGELSSYFSIIETTSLMNKMAGDKNFSHIITAGDNFYSDGITNINYRFKPWFVTSLFRQGYIEKLPIYPTLGNHDCHVDYRNEILYSDYNAQWNMESDYYELITPLKDVQGKSSNSSNGE